MTAQSSQFRSVSGFATVSDQFAQCRALTHNMPTVLANIVDQDARYLFDDGLTDGGCYRGGVYGSIPTKADPNRICAPGRLQAEFPGVLTGLIFTALAIVLVPLSVSVLVCYTKKVCCFRSRKPAANSMGTITSTSAA